MAIPIKQHLSELSESRLDKLDALVVVLPAAEGRPLADAGLPHAELLRQRLRRRPAAGGPVSVDLPNRRGTRVVITVSAPGRSRYQQLEAARKALAPALAPDPREVAVMPVGGEEPWRRAEVEAHMAALLAAGHAMPSFKSASQATPRLKTAHVYGMGERLKLERISAAAEGNNLARYLTALPANHLTPRQYLSWITALAKQHGWRLQFYDRRALQRKRAGAFLAVAQGSADNDAGIVHLRYTPPKGGRTKPRVALAGKGICFDTGGMNLKSAGGMLRMHGDMAGSAAALGTLLALTQLGVDFPVDCWLALAQNHIGPEAYKQSDVVTAANGTTIEVVHTDAEGRMVLADTLALASAAKPALIIDFATLTGSCVHALGRRYAGALTNRDEWREPMVAAGRAAGERVWPFPFDADYDEGLSSHIADIKQCTLDDEADHILAARFLSRFVGEGIGWVHLDLSAAHHKGGLGAVPTDVTGFGVGFALELLLGQDLASA